MKPGERMTLRRLAEAYGALGRFDAALTALTRSSELFARAGDANGEALAAYSFGEIGHAHAALGDRAAAEVAWRASLELLRRITPDEAAEIEALL